MNGLFIMAIMIHILPLIKESINENIKVLLCTNWFC